MSPLKVTSDHNEYETSFGTDQKQSFVESVFSEFDAHAVLKYKCKLWSNSPKKIGWIQLNFKSKYLPNR